MKISARDQQILYMSQMVGKKKEEVRKEGTLAK